MTIVLLLNQFDYVAPQNVRTKIDMVRPPSKNVTIFCLHNFFNYSTLTICKLLQDLKLSIPKNVSYYYEENTSAF